MNKREERHLKSQLKPLRPVYLLVVSAAFLTFGLYQMRQNNLQALRLRDKVNQVDKANGNVEAALKELRTFVYAHMNTGLSSGQNAIKPPVQLKYRYERLVKAEKDRVSAANTSVYTQAQHICEQANPVGLSGKGRVPCIQDYVFTHGAKEQPIPDGLYKFDFVAPFWSPDLAGLSLLLAAVFFLFYVLLVVLNRWLTHSLKRRASD